MAQVTLQVVVQDQQVQQLQQKINQLSNTQITITVNSDDLRTMNTRLLNATNRTQDLNREQQNLQNSLRNSTEGFRQETEQINQNSNALNQNRQQNQRNQRQQQQQRNDHRQHNEDLRQQGILYDILGRSLTSFIARMTAYRAVYAGIRAITNGFTEALQTLKAVDDELVTVRKVTGFDPYQMADVEAQAYAVASRYGASASDYVSGVAEFARAGYKELSGDLAELAQKTQIVGDTTAEVANQFLLSVDAAYKYNGSVEQLTRVLDGANEIDNKYATSIQKIAEGMGIVAPVAAQMHVSVDELAASIGTITAVTQRSGTETARALRALFLNIVGDTKTEIEEGVTWTTGEIAGLRDVIKVYAKDAYDAAQATGSIIDPMKAMEGLSKSLKDGLLSEQELMQMVSDIGGKLRTSQLLALINNWDMYESMLQDYRNAYGSADKEISNAMDSWTRKSNVLKNTWTEFVKTGLDSSVFKFALDALTWFVERLDSLPAVLTRILLLVGAFNLDNIAESLGNLVSRIQNMSLAMTALSGTLAGIAVIWGVVSFAVQSYKQAQEEARKAAEESIKATQSDLQLLDDLKNQYTEIVDSTSTAADKTQQLTEFKKALIEQYGFEKDAVEQINLERQTGIDLLNQEAEASLRRTLSENQGAFSTASDIYNGTTQAESFWYYLFDEDLLSAMERFGSISSKDEEGLHQLVVTGKNLRDVYENLGGMISVLEKKQLSRNGLTLEEERLLDDLRERYNDLGTQMEQYGSLYESQIELQAKYNLLIEGVSGKVIQSKDAFDGLKRTLEETYGSNQEVWEAMNRMINEMFPQFTQSTEETTDAVEAETKAHWENQAALDANADSTKRLAAAKADAEAAARDLIPVLFDEEGKLTDAGLAALQASDYLADLVQAEINLQNETARANYANIRAQLAALSTDAVRAAMSIIAAYNAAQAARDMGYSVGNLGYDREHLPTGTLNALDLLRQLEALESQINSTTIQASTVGTYGTGASSNGGRTSGSSGGRTGGSSSTSTPKPQEDARLVALRDRVALLRSELALSQARGDSEEQQVAIMRQIVEALREQANYMISIGEDQVDINGLLTDAYNYENQINDLLAEEEDTTDHFLESLRDRIDLLESELEIANLNGTTQERIELMEQIAAALEEERDYLISIGGDQIEINNLTAESLRYHNQISQLMQEEAESASRQADAVRDIQTAYYALQNAMSQRNVHIYNAETGQWEWAANPNAVQSARQNLLGAISSWYGAGGGMPFMDEHGNLLNNGYKGGVSNFGGTNNYGATYNIGGIQISEQDAKSMSLYQLLQLSKSLGIYTRTA